MAFQFSNSISLITKVSSAPPAPPPPPLNLTDANAVWSTRLRISRYTGPCLQLRRSSNDAIENFFADANGSLGTAAGATGTSYSSWKQGSTTFVVTWYDQSGNNNITQSTPANQPIYSDISGIIFNGSTQFLTTDAYKAALNTSSFTIIYSATNLNYGAYGTIISSRYSNSTFQTLRGYTIYKLPTNDWYFQFGKSSNRWGELFTDVSAIIHTRYIAAFNQSKSTNTLSSNIKNVSTQVVTAKTTSSTDYSPVLDTDIKRVGTGAIFTRIGAGNTDDITPSAYFNGYINDLFYFGTSLSLAQQTTIINGL